MDGDEHEFPFLQEVHTPQDAPKVDIVFVHGLNPRGRNDHPFETWTAANHTFWPRDFLAKDLPYARVFVYGYNSNITDPQTMSNASVKDHANTLLNLLDMERSPHMQSMPPKIIFIGHSLGGLVIKQALLNAKEDPKYNSIRTATSGLVFFGTPHRGSKSTELGKIAASVARFVSNGSASNDLLNCLEYNSLFTRQMTDRFRHQLEDYRVVSFIEGKKSQLAGMGPASFSQLIVDEESAVLGLSGLRETQLKLDADHSKMCKISTRGPMYHLVKGNIKQLVDQALLSEQGYIPQRSPHPSAGPSPPPVPPRMHSNSSQPYSPPGRPNQPSSKIVGLMFTPLDNDPRSIRSAELMNKWKWDEARDVEYELFQDYLRSLGGDNLKTLSSGYNLATIELEADYLSKATEWCQWVSENAKNVLGPKHPLFMKAESLMGQILLEYGRCEEAESVCANVLARQQMTIGEDHLNTLETRRRIGRAYSGLARRENAVTIGRSLVDSYKNLLGENHILVFGAALETLDWIMANPTGDYVTTFLPRDVQEAVDLVPQVHKEIQEGLGPLHPLTIRALQLVGQSQVRSQQMVKASETLRRALAMSEETLGPNEPLTMAIVSSIGLMYTFQALQITLGGTSGRSEALPWLVRYLDWLERRRGSNNKETSCILKILGDLHMGAKEYEPAQKYYERALSAYGTTDPKATQMISTNLQLCRMNTSFLPGRTGGRSGLSDLLSSLQRY